MVDVFYGVMFPVGRVTRRPQGQRNLPADAPAPTELGTWTRTSEARPISIPQGQVDVMFGSRDWGWALVGLYTNWSDEEVAKGAVRWQIYDQEKDRYVDFFRKGEPEPEFWMHKPLLPMPGQPSGQTDQPLSSAGDSDMTDDKDKPEMSTGDIHADLQRRLAASQEEVERLRDENHEFRSTPWPEWAEAILKKLRSYGLDVDDEVHLANEFENHMDEFEAEIRRQCARTASPVKGSSFELSEQETDDLEGAMALAYETVERKVKTGKGKPDAEEARAFGIRIARLRGRLAAFDERARKAKRPKAAAAAAAAPH